MIAAAWHLAVRARAKALFRQALHTCTHVCTRVHAATAKVNALFTSCARYRRKPGESNRAVPRDINNATGARKEKSMKNQVNVYGTCFPGESGSVVLRLNNVAPRNQCPYWISKNMAEYQSVNDVINHCV